MSRLFLLLCVVLIYVNLIHAKEDIGPAVPELKDTDNYIVVFKQDVTPISISQQIQRLKFHQVNETASTNSTKKITTSEKFANIEYNTIGKFRWYSAKFQSSPVEEMLNSNSSESVHYWVKDTSFSLQEFIQLSPPSWGLDRIDQRQGLDNQYRFSSSQGEGVTVYLMDSGIREDHQDIAGRVAIGKTVVGDVNDPSDNNGHGTFVAGVCCGTTYGVAKKAKIVSVKTLDDEGNGKLSDLLIGLQWIVEQHLNQTNAKTTNDAIEQAISHGIHFSIAAGNYGEDACKYSPGSATGAITVGAIDEDDSVSYYSNFGKCVDIFAPGTNIKSIWPTSDSATHTLTGTSMAAPHVAGTMAIYLSQNNYTPASLSTYIKKVSSLITENFAINNTGSWYNENKTVIDNAINTGYKVPGLMDKQTRVNILFSHPVDGTQFWVFGQTMNAASTISSTLYSMTLVITAVFILLL
ncbi:subtilisin-like protein [Backusella circina FSU 941]|nr:subtilisin-like protein [Backusella circina FSU 941]